MTSKIFCIITSEKKKIEIFGINAKFKYFTCSEIFGTKRLRSMMAKISQPE
jgi:hypothetical protein